MPRLLSRLYDLSPRQLVRFLSRPWRAGGPLRRRSVSSGGVVAPRIGSAFLARQDRQIRALLERVADGESLDQVLMGFDGRRFGERVVEYPYTARWLLDGPDGEDLLDVGCVLNKALIAPLMAARCHSLWLCNPALETPDVKGLPLFYHLAPLAEAFPAGRQFLQVTCLSTLEHIGYDNSHYGVEAVARYDRPTLEPVVDSLHHLGRLVAPGGRLLISVPYGLREVVIHPSTGRVSSQVFNQPAISELLEVLRGEGLETEAEVFVADGNGWRRGGVEPVDRHYGEGCPGAAAVALMMGRRPAHGRLRR